MKSSSGGIFTLIAELIIDKGGAVFGAAFDGDFNVHHISVEAKSDLYKLRGSKYLQSTIGNAYKEAEKALNDDRYVLFTGTPCQIDGLLHYLKRDYEKLYTQDMICHGVPSPKLWQTYLKYQIFALGGDLNRESLPAFRRKDEGWKRYSVSLRFTCDTEYRQTLDKDLYMRAFISNICLRPSCYSCHSKSLNRNSDITLADFWGIENIMPEMFDDKGTSLIFVNTEKGKVLFDAIGSNIEFQKTDIQKAARNNSSAYKSPYRPINRKYVYKKLNNIIFDELVEKYEPLTLIDKIKIKSRLIVDKMKKNC